VVKFSFVPYLEKFTAAQSRETLGDTQDPLGLEEQRAAMAGLGDCQRKREGKTAPEKGKSGIWVTPTDGVAVVLTPLDGD